MEGENRHLLYQKLARLGLVLTCVCLFVSVWSLWEYCGYGEALLAENADLTRGSKYYDWNRD